MEATTTYTPVMNEQTPRLNRWQRLSGDRLATIGRWFVVILLLAISPMLTDIPIWPIPIGDPVYMLIFAFLAFSLLTTIALFVPVLDGVLRYAFVVDVVLITLLVVFNNEQNGIFFALYVLPLMGAASHFGTWGSLGSGLMAAFLYCAAYLFSRFTNQIPLEAIELTTLALRAFTIACIPWFTCNLAERLSDTNRYAVMQAHLQSDESMRNAQSYLSQMKALYEVAYTLSTTPNYQQVLDSALYESHKLVPYEVGMVLLAAGKPDHLYVAAARPDADRETEVKVSQGPIGEALRTANAVVIDDISKEPELLHIASLRGCRSAYVIPLRAALRTYGVMLIAGNQSTYFRREQLEMLTALANYAIIALHNAQLLDDLRQERTKLISKEEDVRKQLARDLHDGPAQALAAITMNVEFIKRLLERDPGRVVEELDKLGALAKRTTHEVRTMLFELRPLVLETQGLRVTLEQYLERFQNNSNGTQIVLDAKNVEDVVLDTKTEGTLFNIVQEAVNNALKHAQAKHIWVRLKREDDVLTTTVQDDGKGFDLNKVMQSYEKRGSFGLLNIDERARLVGGAAELHSAPGQGTTVRIIVPLE